MRGCQRTSTCPAHLSCPSICCWNNELPPRGPDRADMGAASGIDRARPGPKSFWKTTSTFTCVPSKVCVCFIASFTSIYLAIIFGTSGKECSCQCRRYKRHGFDPWVEKMPWRRKWQPTPVFLPGKFYGVWQAIVPGVTKSRT